MTVPGAVRGPSGVKRLRRITRDEEAPGARRCVCEKPVVGSCHVLSRRGCDIRSRLRLGAIQRRIHQA